MWKRTEKNAVYYRERVLDPVTGGHKTLSVKVEGKSRADHKQAQEDLYRKVEAWKAEREHIATTHEYHFSDVAKFYKAEQEATMRPATCDRNASTLRTLEKILGDFDMSTVTAGYIRERLIATGKAPGTINQYLKRLKGFLRWAYQNDYLQDSSVYEKLRPLKDMSHKAKISDKYLEAEELTKLLAGMEIPRYRLLTAFLGLTGLRIGEAIALDRDDIDTGFIHVTKSVRIRNNSMGEPKTLSSIRDIYIQDELAACLRQIGQTMDAQQMAFGYPPVPYLFANTEGKRIVYNTYRRYLEEMSEKIIGRKISPHALRHTHTSLLAEQGVSLDIISRRLGHEDSKMTRDIYFHITKNLKMKDAAEIAPIRLLS